MSLKILAVAVVANTTPFVDYPAFILDRPRIEVVTDKGPILEMVVRCKQGTAIISYSKIERVYCDPQLRCARDPKAVARRACG
jgi:hypothetical protein